MTVTAIPAIGAEVASALPPTTPVTGATFDSMLSGLNGLNTEMLASQSAVANLALGRTDNLHQVMMGMEKTRLEFELALSVRNKMLEAYQELMRMQV